MVSSRSEPITPSEVPKVVTLPGLMLTRLVPNWVNSASTNRCSPSPMEVSRITAAMPTAMPRPVSTLCSRLARIEPVTKRAWSRASMAVQRRARAWMGSSRAARRAGSREKTSPVASAVPRAATMAQEGGPALSSG